MARLKLTKLALGQVRLSVVENMGGTEVESTIDGCVQIVWNANPAGSSFQFVFAPDAVVVVEDMTQPEQDNASSSQPQAN